MNKIPTIFVRDESGKITRTPHPDCDWVFRGEGTPTLKRDGTNIKVAVSAAWAGFIRAWKRRNPTRDEKACGCEPGYVDVDFTSRGDMHIVAAIEATDFSDWPDGQWPCEALGPKIQGGIEENVPCLYPFSFEAIPLAETARTYEGIRSYLEQLRGEGIVWHHADGRMAKIKRRDFGFPWPIKEDTND